MASRTWDFRDEDLQRYRVELEHGYWSGKRVIRLNGKEVLRATKLMDTGTVHRFEHDGHGFAVRIGMNGVTFDYGLEVDGRRIEPSGTVIPRPVPQSTRTWDGTEAPPAAPAETTEETAKPLEDAARLAQRDNGARWFYWIAGLTVINAALFWLGTDWGFAVGTLVSFFLQGMVVELAGETVSWVVHVLVAGLFLFLGRRALAGDEWAFIVGGAIYAVDTAIVVWAQDWIGLAVHGFAMYAIVTGWLAQRGLNSVAEASAMPVIS